MAQVIHDQFQPINFNAQIVSLTTASATSSRSLPACGAVQIASGGSPLFFSFVASASSGAGTRMMMMPANTVEVFQTQGNHTISLKIDGATAPTTASITPMVGNTAGTRLAGDPSFQLDFTDGGDGSVDILPSIGQVFPTFTRATVAWTKLSSGLWAQMSAGVPRAFYSGFTTAVGSYLGYIAEGAGTQLVTPTASIRDMTDASWTKGATMTAAKTGTGIDGVANSCSRLTAGAVAATNTAFQTLVAAATSRTYSVWLKRVTGTGTINITQDGGSTFTDVTALINASTFTQVSLTASVNNAAFGIQMDTNTDVILADFNQFESGAFATSPMAAAGAARNADTLTYPISSAFWNDNAFTAYVKASIYAVNSVTNQIVLNIHDGTTNNRHTMRSAPSAASFNCETLSGGASQFGISLAGVTVGASFKVAYAAQANDAAARENDGAIGTDTTGSMPTGLTTISVGLLNSSQHLYGAIQSVALFRTMLPDAQLQALTA